MRWCEFAARQPRLAALGERRLWLSMLLGSQPATEERYAIEVRNTTGWSPEPYRDLLPDG